MNITHLKYAMEIAKTHSLNKAAENLYMAQPNLSRAIKELEENIGISIFNRKSHGMDLTVEGEEFLEYAKKILKQIDEVESLYDKKKRNKQNFSVLGPRSSYVSYGFAQFAGKVDKDRTFELYYKETNSARAIEKVLNSDYNLAIIRYAVDYDQYFNSMFLEKHLSHETITEFHYILVMSQNHPLAEKDEIFLKDLEGYTEIAHPDPFVPSLSKAVVKKNELPETIQNRIYVFERASQFDLLEMTQNTYMWVSNTPFHLLEKYHLVQKPCLDNNRRYKDVLIHKEEYKLSELDNLFITEVCNAKRKYL